jgi:hypothetical protein
MLIARPSSSTPRIAGIPIWTEKRLIAKVPRNSRPMNSSWPSKGTPLRPAGWAKRVAIMAGLSRLGATRGLRLGHR